MIYVNIALGFAIVEAAVIIFCAVLIGLIKYFGKKSKRSKEIIFKLIPLRYRHLEYFLQQKFSVSMFGIIVILVLIDLFLLYLFAVFYFFESAGARVAFMVIGIVGGVGVIIWYAWRQSIIETRIALSHLIGTRTHVVRIPVVEYDTAVNEKNPPSHVRGYDYAVSVGDRTFKIQNRKKLQLVEGMLVEIISIIDEDTVKVKII